MSKQIDEKVVSMEFDNKRFEANVKTSMRTIDKLKKSLNFDSAAKGFESINKASKNMNFDSIVSGVESLQKRFSTFGIVGMRVIENITDSMLRLSKRTMSFITNSIVQGGKKRAMNLENAHFQLQGLLKDEEAVSAVMKNVNDSVDGTAYSLDSAAKVASQLAASGIRAGDRMFSSLRAVAGVAAMTNSEYDDIGRIFTKVAGQGRLMGDDLLSLSSRGMNAAATLASYLNITEAEVRDFVSKGKISFEIFSQAMDDSFGEHAKKANETLTGSLSNVKAALARIGALFVSPLVVQNGSLVNLLNTIRVKINDIKSAMVPIADTVTSIVKKIADSLNTFIGKINVKKPFESLGNILHASNWDTFIKKVNDAGISTDKFTDKLKEVSSKNGISIDELIKKYGTLEKVISSGNIPQNILIETLKSFVGIGEEVSKVTENITDKLEYYNTIVRKVIRGDFGNGAERVKSLTEAGYEYVDVQKLVNYVWKRNGKTWSNCSISADELTKVIGNLSTEEIKSIGYTSEQAQKIKELAEEAEKSGTPINELISSITKPSKKKLLIGSLTNVLTGLKKVIKSIQKAWKETFNLPKTSDVLYRLINSIYNFSEKLVISDEKAEKLKQTFKGLFAVLDIARILISGALKVAFSVIQSVLSSFNIEVIDLTGNMGEAIVKFRDWLKENDLFKKAIKFLTPVIKNVFSRIKDVSTAVSELVKNNEKLQKVFTIIRAQFNKASDAISNWAKGLADIDNIPKYLISGFANGLKDGIPRIKAIMIELGKGILTAIKGVLGIHSPSTEFEEIGENSIAGFIQGIQNGAFKAWNALKEFGAKCIEVIKNIDFGSVITLVYISSILYLSNRVLDIVESFSKLAGGIGSMFSNIGKGMNKLLTQLSNEFNAKALETRSIAVLNFAKAIAILATSIYMLSKLDAKDLWGAVGAISVLSAVMLVFAAALNEMDFKGSINLGKIILVILGLSAALLILAKAMKSISGLSLDELLIGSTALVILGAFITGLIASTKLASKDIDQVGMTLLKISASMLLLVFVIKQISKLEPSVLTKGLITITLFAGIITGLIAATKLVGKDIDKIGSTILMISSAMLLMSIVIQIISSMDAGGIAKGLIVITAFSGIITGLIAATKLVGKGKIEKIGAAIIGVGAAMALMAITMEIVSNLDTASIAKGIFVIGAFGGIIAGLIASTRFAGKDLKKVGATLLLSSMAIGILAAASVMLGLVRLDHLAKGIVAMGMLSTMMMGLIKATEKAKNCKANLTVLTVAIAVMAGSLAALSFIDSKKLASAALALTSVMGTFAIIISSTKLLGNVKSILGPMTIMTSVVAALGGIIYTLARLDPGSSLESAISLSLLLTAMSISLTILSHIAKSFNAKDIALGVASLTAMAIPLLAFVGVLAVASSIYNAANNAILLTGMAIALTALLIPLSIIGTLMMATGGGILLGIVALTAMAIPLLAFIGVLASMQGIQNATINANALIDLTNAISDVLVKISLVAPLAILGVTALSALTGLMIGIGALAITIGSLMEAFPSLEYFFDRGLPILSKLAYGIGDLIGSLVSGFSESLASSLPEIGLHLSQFMTNLTTFIAGAKLIDDQLLKNVGILTASILALTAADFISNIESFLTMGSISQLGSDLSKFMMNLTPFIVGAKTLDGTMLEGVKALSEAILVLTTADLLNSITSWITGGNSISEFASQLVPLGDGLLNFSASVDGINVKNIKAASESAKTLAEMADIIPNEGGLEAWFSGENSISKFANELPLLGAGLLAFSMASDGINVENIKAASESAKALAEMADTIPNEGGIVAWFSGENSISKFANELPLLGAGLLAFSTASDGINVENIKAGSEAAKALAEMANTIPNEGGIKAWFSGENSISKFANELPLLGAGLLAFSTAVTGIVPENITAAANAAKNIAEMVSLLPKNIDSIGEFGSKLEIFGQNIASYFTSINEVSNESIDASNKMINAIIDFYSKISIDKLDEANSTIEKTVETLKNASEIKEGSADGFTSVLANIAQITADAIIESFKDMHSKVTEAGKILIDKVIDGIKSKEDDVKNAGKDIVSNAATAIQSQDQHDRFKMAGRYLGDGLIEGINSKKSAVYRSAFELGQQAVQGELDGQQSASPSKATIKAGKWLGEGLLIGIKKMGNSVYQSSYNLGETATDAISSTISRMTDIFDSNIDAQPTIRPVLDLSNVTAGAGTINRMFGTNPSIGVLTKVGSISSMMNSQNGSDKEVISAIKDLGHKLDNKSGDTYNFGDFTYDDSSNVSDAVRTLVRAVKIEGRK